MGPDYRCSGLDYICLGQDSRSIWVQIIRVQIQTLGVRV